MKRVHNSPSDIISTLPSDIADNILKRLPLKDAVRTSVLSSRWKCKWRTLPELEFRFGYCLGTSGINKLKAIIYRVLLRHSGPLVRFELSNSDMICCIDIDNWVIMLLKKDIHELTLCYSYDGWLPIELFAFDGLRHLKLTYGEFVPPPTFKGFSRLVNLHLQKVVIATQIVGNFISNCPLLERLTLSNCTRFDYLEINAPNLTYFHFEGIFDSICFRNTSLLADICVILESSGEITKQHEDGKDSNLNKFFGCLPAIEKLSLGGDMLEFLGVGNVPESLSSTLNHLRILNMDRLSFEKFDAVSFALCLLKSSPNLQRLEIRLLYGEDTMGLKAVGEFLQAQDFSKHNDCSLREVRVKDFSGLEPEMQFIKFLMGHSTALEKMVIILDLGIDSHDFKYGTNKKKWILREVATFPRASPKAEVSSDFRF